MSFFKQGSIAAWIAAAVLSASATANAGTISFTDAAWSGANGQSSYTVGSTTISAHPDGKTLTQSATDGLGVTWFLDRQSDEINNHEWLKVDFGGVKQVESVAISNLFYERICVILCGPYYAEKGYYKVEGGDWTAFSAANLLNPNTGELSLALGGVSTSWIKFSTEQGLLDVKHDFSVRSITLSNDQPDPVPEPTTLALLGLTLVGGAARLRRRP